MLTPQEQELVLFGKKNGKNEEQIMQALSKFRATQQQPKEPIQPKETIGGDISTAFKGGLDYIQQGRQEAGATNNPIKKTEAGLKMVGGAIQSVFSPLAPINKYIGKGLNYVSDKISENEGVQKFAMSDAGKTTSRIAEDVVNTTAGLSLAGAKPGLGVVKSGVGTVAKTTGKVATAPVKVAKSAVNTIETFGEKVKSPNVSTATRISLNPKEALKGTGVDIDVSVGGKLKKLSQVSPEEYSQMQLSTQRNVNKFTVEAEKFKQTRNPANDPTEIVGRRVDTALTFADKKRQGIGQKMGEIEKNYTQASLPIAPKTLDSFANTLKSIDNPKFGVDTADAPIVRKLVSDFDKLEQGGATIGERLEFVRAWDKYLNDSKDAFGNFKENATTNTRIQSAVKTIKDETVDAIAQTDSTYRGLRSQYSTYKQLDEIGNSLLGKNGALGARVKGGATVKRALKSNSDAGARQFLIKLKELTGYDAIKDGDLALTAMNNVGDYQGLSLLEVLREGKTGLIGKSLESVQNKVVGDEQTRVQNFIKK